MKIPRIGFTASLALCLSCLVGAIALVAEDVCWLPVPDATGYRVSYGVAGSGTTNQVNTGTNTQTFFDRVAGTNLTGRVGVTNLNLILDQRYFLYVQTLQVRSNVSVISDPSSVILYTPRGSPVPVVLGQ